MFASSGSVYLMEMSGCLFSSSRVVSTQMLPDITMKVMVHENETYQTVTSPLSSSTPSSRSTSSC